MTKRIHLRLLGEAMLPALAVSIAVVLTGTVIGLSDGVAERASQMLFFAVFLSASHAQRLRGERPA